MNIAIVGWGVETQSAFAFFGNDHTYAIVSEEPRDDFPDVPNVTVRFNNERRNPGLTGNSSNLSYLDGLENFDKIIISQVARKNLEKVYPENSPIWPKVTTTLQIFFEKSPTKNIIGVTGTKGKGTTSTLITEMLRAAGKTVYLAGNIGTPMLDLVPMLHEADWVVLELSSFQLYKFPYSPHIGVHLMMIPEHIEEWHKTMEDYVQAKRNIFSHQSENDIAVYFPENTYSTENAHSSPGTKIPYGKAPGAYVMDDSIFCNGTFIVKVDDVALRGKHNIQNICAAVTAVWQITQDAPAIATVIRNFTGLEHRLQTVRKFNDITYIDDSFGTTPDTTIVALDAFTDEKKVLIVGGHNKGSNYQLIVDRILYGSDDVRHVVCIGPVGNWIAHQLVQQGFEKLRVSFHESANAWTIQQIVYEATRHALPGDIVLLSAGTSSFGIFKDYKDRGNQFIAEVTALK